MNKCKNIFCARNLPEDTYNHYDTLCDLDINPDTCPTNIAYKEFMSEVKTMMVLAQKVAEIP